MRGSRARTWERRGVPVYGIFLSGKGKNHGTASPDLVGDIGLRAAHFDILHKEGVAYVQMSDGFLDPERSLSIWTGVT